MATVLILLLMVVPSAIVRGMVVVKMWSWFIVPFGVSGISVPHAVGLAALVGLLTHQGGGNTKNKDQAELIGEAIGTAFLAPLLILLVGYIVQSFM